jgi:hypothetical protein
MTLQLPHKALCRSCRTVPDLRADRSQVAVEKAVQPSLLSLSQNGIVDATISRNIQPCARLT